MPWIQRWEKPPGTYYQLLAFDEMEDQEDCHRYIVCKACYTSGVNGNAQGGEVMLCGHATLKHYRQDSSLRISYQEAERLLALRFSPEDTCSSCQRESDDDSA